MEGNRKPYPIFPYIDKHRGNTHIGNLLNVKGNGNKITFRKLLSGFQLEGFQEHRLIDIKQGLPHTSRPNEQILWNVIK